MSEIWLTAKGRQVSLTPARGARIVHGMGLSRRFRRLLPVALGIAAGLTMLAILTVPDSGAVSLVCNPGTDLDQPAYERCIAELPARQAKHNEDVRVGSAMRPVVALAGGISVALAPHLIGRSRATKRRPVDDDPWTLAGGARTG